MKRLVLFFAALFLFVLIGGPVSAQTTFKATLTWVDNSNNEDGFKIQRALDGPLPTFAEVGQVGPNVVSFVDQPIQPGAAFCWRIVAFNVVGSSLPSPVACATAPSAPAAPGVLQIVITIAGTN